MADRLVALEALRDLLAERLEADKGPQTAAIARQYREVLRDIDELERNAGRKGSIVDELAGRREARGADASGESASGRRGAKQRGGRG